MARSSFSPGEVRSLESLPEAAHADEINYVFGFVDDNFNFQYTDDDRALIVERVREKDSLNWGYNAQTDKYEDLVKSGVIDAAVAAARRAFGSWIHSPRTSNSSFTSMGLAT